MCWEDSEMIHKKEKLTLFSLSMGSLIFAPPGLVGVLLQFKCRAHGHPLYGALARLVLITPQGYNQPNLQCRTFYWTNELVSPSQL